MTRPSTPIGRLARDKERNPFYGNVVEFCLKVRAPERRDPLVSLAARIRRKAAYGVELNETEILMSRMFQRTGAPDL